MNIIVKKAWEYYGDVLGRTVIHPQFIMRNYVYEAIRQAKRYARGDLVDIGCGTMPYKKELLPFLSSYTGVDHPKISKLYHGIEKPDVLADARALPFKDGSFDTVLFLQVLEYIDEPQRAFSEISRILRLNGILILSVPFLYPIHDPPFDQARYTESFLLKLLKASSMRVLVCRSDGGILALVFQSVTLFILRQLKDSIGERNWFALILVIPGIVLLPVWTILGNLLVGISTVFPVPYASKYFTLNYTLVAKKI